MIYMRIFHTIAVVTKKDCRLLSSFPSSDRGGLGMAALHAARRQEIINATCVVAAACIAVLCSYIF